MWYGIKKFRYCVSAGKYFRMRLCVPVEDPVDWLSGYEFIIYISDSRDRPRRSYLIVVPLDSRRDFH